MRSLAATKQSRRDFVRLIRLYRLWMVVLLTAASLFIASESGASAQAPRAAAEFAFDIPAQPLASSLKAYSAITGLALYYESNLIDGRRAPSLRGSFSSEAALGRLLEETGFAIASFAPGSFTILAARPPAQPDLAALRRKASEFTPYFAVIQAGLRAAFCQAPAVQTDAEELFVRLWIAPTGAVARAEILSRSGSEERDRAYAAAIRTLVIGQPPPPSMPQPVTMMILPRASRAAAECSQLGTAVPVRASTHE